MAWLVRADIAPQWFHPAAPAVASPAAGSDAARDEWWGVYYRGAKMGYTHQTWKPRGAERGTAVTTLTELELPVQGTVRPVTISMAALLDPARRLEGVGALITSGPQTLALTGARREDRFEVRLETGGRPAGTLTLPPEVQVPALLTAPWAIAGARPGSRWTREVFDPVSQQRQTAVVEVVREESPALPDRRWLCLPATAESPGQAGPPEGACGGRALPPLLVIRTTLAGLATTSWVTREGLVLREETPLGFAMRREAPEEARLIHRRMATDAPDLSAQLAVPTDVRLADPRATRRLTVRLLGVEDAAALQLASPRQRWSPEARGGLLTITQEPADGIASGPLPARDPAAQRWLQPSPLVQSDDPAIRAQARAVVGDETDAWAAARRLAAWVARTLAKTPSVGVPSAVEVLRVKQGDCNEHTVLFAALARSVGLPTQMCAGLLYHRGAFYYHAWPRVFVGEWVEMDPTLGQMIADATHLQLIEGDLHQQARILGLLGRLRIEAVRRE